MTTATLAAITPPDVEYSLLSPMLLVFGFGVIGVIVEAFAPRSGRWRLQLVLSLTALGAALIAVIAVAIGVTRDGGIGRSAMSGAVIIDRPALFLQGLLVVVSILAVAFMAERGLERVVTPSTRRATPAGRSSSIRARFSDGPGAAAQATLDGANADMFTPSGASEPNSDDESDATRAGGVTTEVFPLTLLAVGGMMLFVACGDLLTMFIALEVFSLPLYLLCALARRRRLLSQEASLKYFLLGAFSSAFFLFGAAFVYGGTGSLHLDAIGLAVTDAANNDAVGLPLIGLALLSVGLLFKVGAMPFHSWVPDVYQGAPTPVTAFMAAATKIAAFGALLRVFYVGFGGVADDWRPVLWVIAILTMLGGAVMAVTQSDIKRLLAYSAVTHTGFILLGLIAYDEAGLSATLFYLAAYAFSTFGAFATVAVVREPTTFAESRTGPSGPHLSGREATGLDQWAGLGRRYPLVGAMFSMFLLAFAGIPLTSGFIAKFDVFAAVAGSGGAVLVVIGVISSAIAAYFYIRIIVAMFFADVPVDAPHVVRPSPLTTVPIALCTAVTIVLGFFPQPLLDLVGAAGNFL
ncbi:NADH-quinone oxidoreductase subunit NuoN [Gordonia sp. NPDC003504]